MRGRLQSISTRFIAGAVCTAVATFLCLIGLVAFQLERSIHRQEVKLEDLSDAKLAATLDADIRLAATRLEFLVSDTARRVSAIASRADTIAAVSSRNVVAMWEMLRPAAVNAELDGIVVLDHLGKVIGASSDNADLIGLDKRFSKAKFAKRFKSLLGKNNPAKPEIYSRLMPASETGIFIPGANDNAVSQIVFVPLFDDFGEISGGLVAQRWLQKHEQTLVELSKIGSVSLAVFLGEKIISRAAFDPDIAVTTENRRHTNMTADGQYIVRCSEPIAPLRICALKPIEELYATQNELTKIGKQEQRSLLEALVLFGLAATALFIVISVVISRQITRPLTRITAVVSSVAAGDYEEQVDGTERSDEVGDISRAVVLLQASARERDSLRANIQVKNEVLKQQEAELRTQNHRFDAALNNMSHGLCMFDADKRLIVSNQRYLELYDLDPKLIVPGMSAAELMSTQDVAVAPSDKLDQDDDASSDEAWPSDRRSAITHQLADGRIISTTRQPLVEGGWVAIFEDVTERQRARDRLVHIAKHDGLTELPNRLRLREHLSALLQRRDAEGGGFGILFLDLDEFKTVNDSLGHAVGDVLLRQVAARLRRLTADEHLVVRLGGDEFAIVTDITTSGPELAQMAGDSIVEISRPYQLENHEVVIGVSTGISLACEEGIDGDELLKQADLALYQAKADGRNTYRFFEEKMGTNVNLRRELITDLRGALQNGELEAYFQPQISLADGTISGFEALMRWHHPIRGMISPAEFIPIAEETGLIVQMGEWILREACKVAMTWPMPVRVAVNISARQLKSKGFAAVLINTLATTGLPPDRLELEVTESVLLSDDEETLSTLLQTKALGVKVSMDDFGTGYSSLSCLRSFPFDKIKIDQSFVRSMAYSDESKSIVKAVVELAQSLEMATTAEGIETEELVEILRACGCTEGQGYFFGKPSPAAGAFDLLERYVPPTKIAVNG